MAKPQIFVISGPSGVGKGTLIAQLFSHVPNLAFSVSATTRAPRDGEQDGVDYYFVTQDEFNELIEKDALLEWAPVHLDKYGTPRKPVEAQLESGLSVILDIDVQGALQVKKSCPSAHFIFIEPPSLEVLESRLRGRHTESEEAIQKRMYDAVLELSYKSEYDYSLVNDNLEQAIEELVSYVMSKIDNAV
jgi:guanylate kinase